MGAKNIISMTETSCAMKGVSSNLPTFLVEILLHALIYPPAPSAASSPATSMHNIPHTTLHISNVNPATTLRSEVNGTGNLHTTGTSTYISCRCY